MNQQHEPASSNLKTIDVPASTAWPVVLAFGVTLSFASLVTSPGIGLVGVLLVVCGAVGWFGQVLPAEHHEAVPVLPHRVGASTTVRARVEHIEVSEMHRARLPVESYPALAGLKGGAAGGVAMIVPALLYGWVAHGSIWYAVNLLGGAGVAHWTNATDADISAFHWSALALAAVIHTVTSLLIGLLYGATLPMWPRRPVLLGGILAPLVWTGLLFSTLELINPFFSSRISWGWFALSQIFFGVVAGSVVARTARIRTYQSLPFVFRAGIQARGVMDPHEEGDK